MIRSTSISSTKINDCQPKLKGAPISFLKAEWAYVFGAFLTLLFIIDPLTTLPAYLTLTKRFTESSRRSIRRKATTVAFGILALFAISGMKFFELFGITLPAFQIAGGILMLIIGITQLNAEHPKSNDTEASEGLNREDIAIFPLGTPLLAGPGAISTVILFSTAAKSWFTAIELIISIGMCMAVVYLILASSRHLLKVLGNTGINLISRLMGIVLTAVAVQFILNGLRDAIPTLVG